MKLKFKKWKPITAHFAQRRGFFINQRATEVSVLIRIDGANMPVVYGMLID